jgi:branched-chain amino acid transport system ATP-binding protein
MPMPTPLFTLEAVKSGYGRTEVLHGVSLEVGAGEIVALIGANGAGKSTLLNTIMGLVPCGGGAIRFDGKALTRQPTPAIVQAGLVQVPERRQLFGAMTVEENLLMGAYTRRDRGGIQAALEEQFARFPILAERRRQRAETFSGGQQQMLAIARALMSQPRLLLLDEPSLGLAPLVAQQILREIVTLRDAGGTVFVVEQNARAALAIADRGYVLENGRITLSGRAADLLGDTAVQDAYLGGAGGANEVEDHIRERKRAILGR